MRLLAEQLLKFCLETLLKERADDLAFFDERVEKGLLAKLEGIVSSEFVRMDYGEAVAVLERAKEKFEFPVTWGIDLQSEHERYLTEKHAKKPVIVMNYPKAIKAFYMRVNDDGKTVAAMDVLAPGIGEIIGGSQREERLDVLDARMDECAIDQAALRVVPGSAPLRHGAARGLRPESSAPSHTSPASPTCATRSRFRERPDTRSIDACEVGLAAGYAALANSSFTDFSQANSFCTLARSLMRSKCAMQFGKADASTPSCAPRRMHQKKCASGAVKWSKKNSRPASMGSASP